MPPSANSGTPPPQARPTRRISAALAAAAAARMAAARPRKAPAELLTEFVAAGLMPGLMGGGTERISRVSASNLAPVIPAAMAAARSRALLVAKVALAASVDPVRLTVLARWMIRA